MKPEIVLQETHFPPVLPCRYFKQQPNILQIPRILGCDVTLYAEGARRKTENVHYRGPLDAQDTGV